MHRHLPLPFPQVFFQPYSAPTSGCQQVGNGYCKGSASHYAIDLAPQGDPNRLGEDGVSVGACGVGDAGTDFYVALADAGQYFGGVCDHKGYPSCAQVSCGDVFEVTCTSLKTKGYSSPCTDHVVRVKVVDACPR